MKHFLERVMKRLLYTTGYQHPNRKDRFLNKLASIICKVKYPSHQRNMRMFLIKKKLYTYYYGGQILKTAKSIGKEFYCGSPSCVNRNTVIKDYVCFNGMHIDGGGKVTIGSYFHSGVGCMMITQSHDYDTGEMIPYGNKYSFKEIIIEDFVWFGRRVTVLPGTTIGEGAIIQAGSVVHGNIPPYAIAGGNPAKVFRYRDIEHFKKLKAEKMFITNRNYCELQFGQLP